MGLVMQISKLEETNKNQMNEIGSLKQVISALNQQTESQKLENQQLKARDNQILFSFLPMISNGMNLISCPRERTKTEVIKIFLRLLISWPVKVLF